MVMNRPIWEGAGQQQHIKFWDSSARVGGCLNYHECFLLSKVLYIVHQTKRQFAASTA